MAAPESVLPAAASGKRIAEVDILRGFALFGILIVNVYVATTLFSFLGTRENPQPRFDGPVDQLVAATVTALGNGRFYLLFAFLFGYSFTLQIAAAERAGVSPRARLLRRCAALMAIGLAHMVLLWIGDILTLYAFLCLILITLRKLRPRTAVITGALLYGGWCTWAFLGDGGGPLDGIGEVLDLPRITTGYTGGFADTFGTQVWLGPLFLLLIWFTQSMTSLGMFLIGMAAGKRELFSDRDLMRRWAPRFLIAGFGVGLPVSAVTFASMMGWLTQPTFWPGVQELINPLMTFGYIAAIVLLAHAPRTAPLLARLAPAGRMAATNYILQSVVLMVLYTGYGFALADDIPPLGVIALALLTFAAQLAASRWWLRRHPYGPVEWLLRAATYLKIPAWRRPSESVQP